MTAARAAIALMAIWFVCGLLWGLLLSRWLS